MKKLLLIAALWVNVAIFAMDNKKTDKKILNIQRNHVARLSAPTMPTTVIIHDEPATKIDYTCLKQVFIKPSEPKK